MNHNVSARRLIGAVSVLVLLFGLSPVALSQAVSRKGSEKPLIYFPSRGEWRRVRPEDVGMDAALLEQAVAFAKTQESEFPPDFSQQEEIFGRPLGALPKTRARTNGLIIRHGLIVAEWGDTEAVDPTYSAAKSYLSTLLGLAIDRGLIKNIADPVRLYVHDGGYDSPHNAKITWEEHARQTSEWEGSMWGKPSDFLGVKEFGKGRREPRELHEPGTFWEYNDVRINRLALSLLRVLGKPLPEVLKNEIMNPIGASDSWRYYGYANSEVEINGKRMVSVSGGTRWGGGLWISARDEARFGYLFLRMGRWRDKQIIPEKWVREATTPGAVKSDYGYLWWLNTDRKQWKDAPTTSYAALGFGSNTIWIDPEHDLVIVWRWHKGNPNELIKRTLAALK